MGDDQANAKARYTKVYNVDKKWWDSHQLDHHHLRTQYRTDNARPLPGCGLLRNVSSSLSVIHSPIHLPPHYIGCVDDKWHVWKNADSFYPTPYLVSKELSPIHSTTLLSWFKSLPKNCVVLQLTTPVESNVVESVTEFVKDGMEIGVEKCPIYVPPLNTSYTMDDGTRVTTIHQESRHKAVYSTVRVETPSGDPIEFRHIYCPTPDHTVDFDTHTMIEILHQSLNDGKHWVAHCSLSQGRVSVFVMARLIIEAIRAKKSVAEIENIPTLCRRVGGVNRFAPDYKHWVAAHNFAKAYLELYP